MTQLSQYLTTQHIVIATLLICIVILTLYTTSLRESLKSLKWSSNNEIWDLRDQNKNLRIQLIRQLSARVSRELILRNRLYFFEQFKTLIAFWKILEGDEAKLQRKQDEITSKYPHFFNFDQYDQGNGYEVAMAYSFIEREQDVEDLWKFYKDIKLYESILLKNSSSDGFADLAISDEVLEMFMNDAEIASEQNTKVLLIRAIAEYETAKKYGAELLIDNDVRTANFIFKVIKNTSVDVLVCFKEGPALGIIEWDLGSTTLYTCDQSFPPKKIHRLYEEFDVPLIFNTKFSEHSFEI